MGRTTNAQVAILLVGIMGRCEAFSPLVYGSQVSTRRHGQQQQQQQQQQRGGEGPRGRGKLHAERSGSRRSRSGSRREEIVQSEAGRIRWRNSAASSSSSSSKPQQSPPPPPQEQDGRAGPQEDRSDAAGRRRQRGRSNMGNSGAEGNRSNNSRRPVSDQTRARYRGRDVDFDDMVASRRVRPRKKRKSSNGSLVEWLTGFYNALFWYGAGFDDDDDDFVPAVNFQDLLEQYEPSTVKRQMGASMGQRRDPVKYSRGSAGNKGARNNMNNNSSNKTSNNNNNNNNNNNSSRMNAPFQQRLGVLQETQRAIEEDIAAVNERLDVLNLTMEMWVRRSESLVQPGEEKNTSEETQLQTKRRMYDIKEEGQRLGIAKAQLQEKLENTRTKIRALEAQTKGGRGAGANGASRQAAGLDVFPSVLDDVTRPG